MNTSNGKPPTVASDLAAAIPTAPSSLANASADAEADTSSLNSTDDKATLVDGSSPHSLLTDSAQPCPGVIAPESALQRSPVTASDFPSPYEGAMGSTLSNSVPNELVLSSNGSSDCDGYCFSDWDPQTLDALEAASIPDPPVYDPNWLDYLTDGELLSLVELGKFGDDDQPPTSSSTIKPLVLAQENVASGQRAANNLDAPAQATIRMDTPHTATAATAIEEAKAAAEATLAIVRDHTFPLSTGTQTTVALAHHALANIQTALGGEDDQSSADSGTMSSSGGEESYCNVCEAKFQNKSQLSTHRSKFHSSDVLHAVKTFGCDQLLEVRRLSRKDSNGKDASGFPCPRCGVLFPLPSNLRRHAAICKKDKPGDAEKPRMTFSVLRDAIALKSKDLYEAPPLTLQNAWTKRLGAAAALKDQDLKKNGQLLDRVSNDGKTYRGRLPVQIAKATKASCDEAMRRADEILGGRPLYELQLLAVFNAEDAQRARPLGVSDRTTKDYNITFEKLMMYVMSLVFLCYGEDMDIDAVPREPEEGLHNACTALTNCDGTFKELLRQLLADHSPESYWRFAAFLYTSALPDCMTSSVLVNFISALALVQPVTGEFKRASTFTPDLSRLIYGFRKCWGASKRAWIEQHIVSIRQVPEPMGMVKSRDHYRQELLRNQHRNDFGADSLFSCAWKWLDALRAYGQGFAANEDGLGCIIWSQGRDFVRVKEHTIYIDAVARMMQNMVKEMEVALNEILQFANVTIGPNDFPLERLTDDASWSAPGASFSTHPSNSGLLRTEQFGTALISRIATQKNDNVTTIEDICFDEVQIDKAFRIEAKFLRLALLTIFMTSGMPCRAEELLQATCLDDAGARRRSFIIGTQGDVYLHLTYHKTEWSSSRHKHNLRYLLPVVGRMWAFYLGDLRPAFDAVYQLQAKEKRIYVFSSMDNNGSIVRWRGDVVSDIMGDLSLSSGLGFRLNVSTNRHLAEAVANEFFRSLPNAGFQMNENISIGHETDSEDGETFSDVVAASLLSNSVMATITNGGADIFSTHSGRSLSTSLRIYAREAQNREGVNRSILDNAKLGSTTWQHFWNLHKITVSNKSTDTPSAPQGPLMASSTLPSTSHLGNHHVRKWDTFLTEIKNTVVDCLISNSLPKSRDEQQPICSGALTQSKSDPRAQTTSARIPMTTEQIQRLIQVQQRIWFWSGPRSVAVADTLPLIASGRSHVACVAGTGGGKSDCIWMAVAQARTNKHSFVLLLVPYIPLITDVLKQAERRLVSACRWSASGGVPDHVSLVVASLNQAAGRPMMQWLAKADVLMRIATVIVDEAHTLLDERSFRLCARRLPDLTAILSAKPWTFLSATIPPTRHADLENAVALPLVWKRDLTHRPNLTLTLRRYESKQGLVTILKAVIQVVLKKHKDAQIMFLTRTRADAMYYSAALGCGSYLSSTADQVPMDHATVELRVADLEAYMSERTNVIVGTPALGSGFDRPRVRFVGIIDPPHSAAGLAQAIGRASRDGRAGEARIFLSKDLHIDTPANTLPTSDSEALQLILSTKVCMRQVLSAWFDGRPATCFELRAVYCSTCCQHLGFSRDAGLHAAAPDSQDSDVDDSEATGAPSQGSGGWWGLPKHRKSSSPAPIINPNLGEKLRGRQEQRETGSNDTSNRPRITSSESVISEASSPDQLYLPFKENMGPSCPPHLSPRASNKPASSHSCIVRSGASLVESPTHSFEKDPTLFCPSQPSQTLPSEKVAPQSCITTQPWHRASRPQQAHTVNKPRQSLPILSLPSKDLHFLSSRTQPRPVNPSEKKIPDPLPPHKETTATASKSLSSTLTRFSGYTTPSNKQTRTSSAYKRLGDAPMKANIKKQRIVGEVDDLDPNVPTAEVLHKHDSDTMQTPCRPSQHDNCLQSPYKSTTQPPRTSWPMDSEEELEDGSGAPVSDPDLPAYTASHQRVTSVQHSQLSPSRAEMDIKNRNPVSPFHGRPEEVSRSNLEATALRMRDFNAANIDALRDWSDYMRAIRDILPKTKHSCPMCKMLCKPSQHAPGRCQADHLNVQAQIQFRNDKNNKWDYGQACYFCWLPQEVCRRRNDAKECSLQPYKEAVRGVLMMLTAYPAIRATAVEVATLFNPAYHLPAPLAPLSMGRDWRDNEYRYGSPTYTAFQAVAAIFFLWDDRI